MRRVRYANEFLIDTFTDLLLLSSSLEFCSLTHLRLITSQYSVVVAIMVTLFRRLMQKVRLLDCFFIACPSFALLYLSNHVLVIDR